VMLLCFSALGIGVVLLGDETLRGYHVLAVLSGYLLYACGVRRALAMLVRLKNCALKKHEKQEGK